MGFDEETNFYRNVLNSQVERRNFLGLSAGALLGLRFPTVVDVQASSPKRLVAVVEEDPPIINPAITTLIASYVTGTPVYNALTRIYLDYSIHPELAESWEASSNGLNYTFKLRRGVKWHDGEPFTSADVKWSLENANSKLQPYGVNVYAYLDHVDTPDDYTAILRLRQATSYLMQGTGITCSCILPKHVFEGTRLSANPANQHPIGTGPWKFKERVSGDHITYVRNPNYFMPGLPKLDELVFQIIPAPASRVAAFQARTVNTIYQNALPSVNARQLVNQKGAHLVITDQRGGSIMCLFNVRSKPLSDVKVRQAIVTAINRPFLVKSVDAGFAFEQIGPISPSSQFYDRSLKDYPYDPSTANQMLDAAGYRKNSSGARFTLQYLLNNTDSNQADAAQIVKQNLAAVGIQVNIQELDPATLSNTAMVALKFDMLSNSFSLGPDPAIGTQRLYDSHQIFNPPRPFTNSSGYVNPTVDQLFAEANVATSVAQRTNLLNQAQAIIWNDVPAFALYAFHGPNVYQGVEDVYVKSRVPLSNQEPYEEAQLVSSSTSSPAGPPAAAILVPIVVVGAAVAGIIRFRTRLSRGQGGTAPRA